MIGSTKRGLKLRSWELDRFNQALIDHIRPHIDALELKHAVVKFTGDGWLVMSPTAASKLRCLAAPMIVVADSPPQIAAELADSKHPQTVQDFIHEKPVWLRVQAPARG